MLNPFAIEKETLLKVAAIRQLSLSIQRILAEQHIDPSFRLELESCVPIDPSQVKIYECRICGKVFNEGRKLGGHVSRAHKTDFQGMEAQDHSRFSEIAIPKIANIEPGSRPRHQRGSKRMNPMRQTQI